jgi:hypothetical protein
MFAFQAGRIELLGEPSVFLLIVLTIKPGKFSLQ